MNWGEVFILMIILVIIKLFATITAWKVSKYGVFSGPHFPVFSPSTGKYGQEKTLYLDSFHAVYFLAIIQFL